MWHCVYYVHTKTYIWHSVYMALLNASVPIPPPLCICWVLVIITLKSCKCPRVGTSRFIRKLFCGP